MSKNILTFDSLTDKMGNELGWRRKELIVLKNKIPEKKGSIQTIMIRASIPFLYAHWEGYVKNVLSYYLTYISNKGLNHNKLKNQFIALSLHKKLGQLEENSIRSKTRIINFIIKNINKQSNIPTKHIINTKSNLNYDVLSDLLYTLDLEDTHFKSQKDLINDLIKERNFIAHGEHRLIDYDVFIEFFKDIISLMEYLKTVIENGAILEEYKVASAQIE